MTIKEKISILAKENGLTLQKLEEELGFGGGTISRWEKSSPSVDKLQKVATLFGITIDELLHDEVIQDGYYTDPDVAKLANEIKNDPDLRILLNAKRSLSKDDMNSIINITKSLLQKERGE